MSALMSVDRGFLVRCQLPLECVFELLLPVGIGAEGVAGHRAARGVELEQLLGHVAHGLLDARLRLLPCRAAKLVERGTRGAGELLNEIEALDRDKELVFAEVAELHELLRLHAELDPLQSDEHPDPVIDVDDEIPDLQVAEVGEECARGRSAALVRLSLFLEDVRFGPELQRPHPADGTRATDGRRRRAPRPSASRPTGRPGRRTRRSRRAVQSSARHGRACRRRRRPRRRAPAPCGSRRPSPACARRIPARVGRRCGRAGCPRPPR